MLKVFEIIGRYFMLMGKVFSRPEKAVIYRRRIVFEMEALGVNSIVIYYGRCTYWNSGGRP